MRAVEDVEGCTKYGNDEKLEEEEEGDPEAAGAAAASAAAAVVRLGAVGRTCVAIELGLGGRESGVCSSGGTRGGGFCCRVDSVCHGV